MINRTAFAAAYLLSTASAASPVEYPSPVAVPHGLFLTLDQRGHPSFNPADGVDQILTGKAGSTRLTESVDWSPAPKAPKAPEAHHSRPTFPLPRIPGDNPACNRADDRPAFCDVHRDPPETDHPAPVPLPAAGWFILAGLGALAWVRRRPRSSSSHSDQ